MTVYLCPKCNTELQEIVLTSYPPKYQKICFNCGWKSEITKEVIEYKDYVPSVCHEWQTYGVTKYCSYCSAEMDEEVKDD